nr:MAG TPA: hypothetical protein [Caudoviricetes sp.]
MPFTALHGVRMAFMACTAKPAWSGKACRTWHKTTIYVVLLHRLQLRNSS